MLMGLFLHENSEINMCWGKIVVNILYEDQQKKIWNSLTRLDSVMPKTRLDLTRQYCKKTRTRLDSRNGLTRPALSLCHSRSSGIAVVSCPLTWLFQGRCICTLGRIPWAGIVSELGNLIQKTTNSTQFVWCRGLN